MEAVRLILAIFAAAFIGWNILHTISYKSSRLSFFERIFLSYGLGLGAVSLEMFLFFFFNVKFGVVQIVAPWALLLVVNFVISRSSLQPDRPVLSEVEGRPTKQSLLSLFLIAGIASEVLYAFFRALIKPIEAYDAIATFAIKAKIFFLAKCIPHDYFYNLGTLFPHVDYPLNISLFETFMYLSMGGLNEQLVKLIFPLYFIAILGILYFGIRRFAGSTYALIFTFALASIQQFNNFATNAYVDAPLSYYYLAGTLFLLYWFKEKTAVEFLYISAVMTALAGWTKNEGLVYCVINCFMMATFLLTNRKDLKGRDVARGIGYVVVIAAILLPWLMVRKTAHVVNSDFGVPDIGGFDIVERLNRIMPMLYEFQRQIFGPKKWNIFWAVLIAALVVYRKKAFAKYAVYITMTILLIMGGYVIAYLVARTEMTTLWSRFIIHFLPIAVYLLAVLLKDEIKV